MRRALRDTIAHWQIIFAMFQASAQGVGQVVHEGEPAFDFAGSSGVIGRSHILAYINL
eukprot:SAG31_NODE_13758_length_848_cov_1.349800_1_plen_58_part_00